MAERYQRQIGENGPPSAYLRNHVTPDAAGAGVASALGQMGNAMDKVTLSIQAYNDKQDEIDLMAATNDYNRRMNAYLNDPEHGQLNTRKLKDARGLLSDTEGHADHLVEDITSRLGEKAAERFRLFEGRLRQPYSNRSATYEAGQRAEYGKVEAESTLQGFMQSVQADPMNSEMLETAVDAGYLVIEQQMQGAPQEAKLNAFKAWASQLEVARIGMVLGENPMMADQMIRQSPYLLPADAAALAAKVKPEVEKTKARGIANDVMSRFGGEYDAANGIEWIRKNISDPDLADLAVSQYSAYMREKNMGIALGKAQQQEAQNQNYEAAVLDYAQDNPWTEEQILNSNLSDTQKATLLNKNNATSSYGSATAKLEKTIPGWNQLSEYQQDMYYFADANTTEELHAAAVALLNEGLGSGLTKDHVKEYINRRLITREEGRRFNAAIDGWDNKNDAQIKGIKNVFDASMNPTKKESPVNGMYPISSYEIKRAELEGYIAELAAAKDPDIVEKVGVKAQMIQNEIIQEVFNLTGKSESDQTTVDIPWVPQPFGIGPKGPTEFAKDVATAKKMLQDTTASFAASKPTLVKPVEFQAVEIAVTPATISADVLGGEFTMTSGFNASRDGGKRQHGGYDFAAPKGTPVKAPSVIGSGLSVTQIVGDKTNAKTGAGNRVVLSGKDEFGNTVEWQFNHLGGVNGALKVGDIIAPGTPLGAVGNSGSVIASPGGDGTHLDIKLKVNGKLMDITKYYASINARRNSQSSLKSAPAAPENAPTKVQSDTANMSEDEKAEYFLGGGL